MLVAQQNPPAVGVGSGVINPQLTFPLAELPSLSSFRVGEHSRIYLGGQDYAKISLTGAITPKSSRICTLWAVGSSRAT